MAATKHSAMTTAKTFFRGILIIIIVMKAMIMIIIKIGITNKKNNDGI